MLFPFFTTLLSTTWNIFKKHESFETWWIVWIEKESLSRHDESHESKKRVFRVMMNRMNRKPESYESSWIVWIENKSLTSHHVLHDSTNESWQVMMTRLDSSFSDMAFSFHLHKKWEKILKLVKWRWRKFDLPVIMIFFKETFLCEF